MSQPPLAYHDGSCCHCGSTENLYRFTEFGKAVCAACYPEFFRKRVRSALRRYGMVRGGETIAIAVSGGKDSTALLHALWELRRRLNIQVVAVHVDMELGEYGAACLEVIRQQAEALGVPLFVDRVADYGVHIAPVGSFPQCSVCGAVRRALLDRAGLREGWTAIAMGHTLDDRLLQMLKRLLTGRLDAPKPVLPGDAAHPRKIKPLSLIPDRASKAYVEELGLPYCHTTCPSFAPETHCFKQVFELLEGMAPMSKVQVATALQKAMSHPMPGGPDLPCPGCGQPTASGLCPLCRLQRQAGAQTPINE